MDGVRECYNNGICIITASGNDAIGIGYKPNEDYYFSTPPSLKETLAVNANDSDLNITNYSNYGTFTDVTAPGEEIYSTYQSDGYTPYYDYLSGTSMSAPMVTSVAAMILDANPDLTPAQVYNIICATAQDEVLGDPKGFDKNAGYGLVDAEAAVEAAKSASASVPVTDLILKPGMSSVTIRNGSKFQPEVLILPAESLADVTWTSSNNSIASVSENGTITAKTTGSAVITARAGSKSVKIKVKVKKRRYSGKDYKLKVRKTSRRSIKLSWAKVPDAYYYHVYVKKPGQKKYHSLKTTRGTSLKQSGLKKGLYSFRIRARYHAYKTAKWYGYSNAMKRRIR